MGMVLGQGVTSVQRHDNEWRCLSTLTAADVKIGNEQNSVGSRLQELSSDVVAVCHVRGT